MCCIGAGPGSEVLGLHEVLPKDTHWYLMDSCERWSHSAQLLLRNIPGIKFNYGAFDITARFHPAHVFKKVSSNFAPFRPKNSEIFLLQAIFHCSRFARTDEATILIS